LDRAKASFAEKRAKCACLNDGDPFQKAKGQAKLPRDLVLYCAPHGFGTEDVSGSEKFVRL
jgi:hypothetical protein